ncbi:MAG: thioredoxin family protein [Patescibacteria group bacterium UBA2163]
MNNITGIIIGIIVIGVVGITYVSLNQNTNDTGNSQINESSSETDTDMNGEDDLATHDDMTDMDDMADMDKGSGVYEEYAPEKLAYAEIGDVVLFFHASWCPSCRGLNADIEKNLDAIPSEVSILKLDYDKESELRKKYSVTYQHTLVQVDADGTLIKKWSGSPTLNALVSEIN